MLMHIAPLLALTPEIKEELYPILLFFGMFAVVFGLGGTLIHRIPRKPGSMLDEILSEKWEDDEEEAEQKEQTPKQIEEKAGEEPAQEKEE